ncbi:MAG TPA: alpha-amylase family glycosyl hydrolase [Bacteroidota bacterium]|nr:alpha-amylase family glycosyl hydrolase [Bacteroidota bacterium]
MTVRLPRSLRLLPAILSGTAFLLILGGLTASLHAQDSVDVFFTYKPSAPQSIVYLPGEFNGWANNNQGVITSNPRWNMLYDSASGLWTKWVRLQVGGAAGNGVAGAYQYKFNLGGCQACWINDPVNPHVNAADNSNTYLYVKNPTIFHFQPNQRNPVVTSASPLITAYIFPKVGTLLDTSSLTITIDGVAHPQAGQYYNFSTELFSYPVPNLPNGPHVVILSAGTTLDTVNFVVQAGYVKIMNQFPVGTWETSWKINGRVENDSVTSVTLVRNSVDTFQTAVSGRTFSFAMPLVGGGDTIKAIADSSGARAVSFPMYITRLVNRAPLGKIAFSGDLYSVTLHADSSLNADGNPSDALTFRWSADTANPAPVAGVDGSTAGQIALTTPTVPGEYYFNLIVSDTNGYSDTTRNYFGVDDSGRVSYPTLASNPAWLKQGRMYLMFFKSATSQGTINAALPLLGYIKNMGYNIIWVMPVMKNAFPINNFYGPGYDIVDFYNVAPEYGTNADFRNFVSTAHALGLKIILDITPNHTSKYHPFVTDIKSFRQNSVYWNFYQHQLITNPNYHPELSPEALTSDSLIVYYYPFSDELLNWNWSDLDARMYMIDVYRYWIKQFGVDGYRFDVYWGPDARANNGNGGENEMGVPVRTALKHIKPDILLLGEDAGTGVGTETIYGDRNGGVDAAYDWNLLHNGVQGFYSGSPQISSLNNNLLNCGSCSAMGFTPGPNSFFMRCMENQDEDRIIYSYSTQLALASNPTMAARSTMPVATMVELSVGLPLVYEGQELGWGFGISGQKENRNRSVLDWNDSLRTILQPHYQKLAHIRKQFSSFWTQQQLRVNGSNGSILGYSRPQNDLTGLMFANFSNVSQSSFVNLSSTNVTLPGGIQDGKTYFASDLYNDSVYQVVFSGGNATLPVSLPAYGSSVMIVSDTMYHLSLPAITGVEEPPAPLPVSYALAQNYPNPFNPSTTIQYDLPKNSLVTLKVYNILGAEVATLVNGVQTPGHYLVTWNAGQFASGVYFYRLTTPTFMSVKKMILLR